MRRKAPYENTKPWISVFSSMGFCPVDEGKPQKDFKQTWEFKMRKASFILKKHNNSINSDEVIYMQKISRNLDLTHTLCKY